MGIWTFLLEVQLPALKARAVQIGGERGRLEGAVFGQLRAGSGH